MKKTRPILAALIFAASSLLAQQPTPPPQSDDAGVVRVTTDLIQLDVTVTDSNGKVVTGLSARDFEIFENGERQEIFSLMFQGRSVGGIQAGSDKQGEQTAPSVPGRPLPPASFRHSVAIVVDDLNMSFGGIYYTKRALRKFVDEQMRPGDLVAIIRTGVGVGTLQQFTSDKRLLLAAIEKIRWNPLGGSIDSLTSVSQDDLDISERFNRESSLVAGGSSKQTTIVGPRDYESSKRAADKNVQKNAAEQEGGVYVQTSLGTVRYIIAAMKNLPGRKAMMLFSDGMAIESQSNKSRSSSVYESLRDTADVANRSSVVVYSFDTKGLRSMSIAASDSTYEIIDGHRGQKERARTRDFKDSQDGLAFIAEQTGGKALLNSDNFNGGIQRALEEQAGYYLLAYVPDAEIFDAATRKFNKIEIRVKRPGLKVSHRSGFFTGNDAGAPRAPRLSSELQIAEALTSPFAQSDISLNINALYADDPADGPYIRSFLHIGARDLTFSDDAGGWKRASFNVVAVAFGSDGVPVENVDSKYTIKTRGVTYEAMLRNGFVYVLMMPLKKPGVYQYRVALRDAGSGKIGSASQVVEVPDLAKQNLAISSVAVEGVSPVLWQNIAQGKVGTNPGQTRVASTLLYDTVLRQFPAGTVLRYGYEIYNAKADGSSRPQLEAEIRILQNGRVIVDGKATRVDTAAARDLKHIRVSNAVVLSDTLVPGDYVLQIIVTDTVAKRKAYQLFPFEITARQ